MTLLILFSCHIFKFLTFNRLNYLSGTNPRKWYPNDGGWQYHVVSTASEWVCAISFDVFMLTLVDEFKSLSMDSPQVSFIFSKNYVNITDSDSYIYIYYGHPCQVKHRVTYLEYTSFG